MGESINYEVLQKILDAKPKHIVQEYGLSTIRKGKRRCFLKDNGASILGVAHMDTVIPRGQKCEGTLKTNSGELFFSPRLDDRLGVYTLLDLLPRLNVKMDILLTLDEEGGMSTGEIYEPEKKYNWIVGFDRKGEDVVCYNYGSGWGISRNELENNLEKHDFKVGNGTCSDISKMEHIGCKAFNVGIGYVNEHHLLSYFTEPVYYRQINRFISFYSEFRGTFMEHKKQEAILYSAYPNYNGVYPSVFGKTETESAPTRKITGRVKQITEEAPMGGRGYWTGEEWDK